MLLILSFIYHHDIDLPCHIIVEIDSIDSLSDKLNELEISRGQFIKGRAFIIKEELDERTKHDIAKNMIADIPMLPEHYIHMLELTLSDRILAIERELEGYRKIRKKPTRKFPY